MDTPMPCLVKLQIWALNYSKRGLHSWWFTVTFSGKLYHRISTGDCFCWYLRGFFPASISFTIRKDQKKAGMKHFDGLSIQLTFTCSKLTIERLEKVWNIFKVNNKNIGVIDVVLVFLSLILKIFHTFFWHFCCWFWTSKC